MNERIKELADRATVYKEGLIEGKHDIEVFDKQKFAKLLIRECCGAADEWYQYHNEIQWDPAQHIKNHFEIEV